MIGVIGGSGFIGSALVRALRQSGHEVRIIDRRRSKTYPDVWVKADVCDPATLTAAVAGCTTLFNLAAEHRDDVQPASLYHETNVVGAEHVCAAAEAHGIERIIFTSTAAVYGAPAGEVDESAPLRPFNDYGRTKLEAEQVFRAWASRGSGRTLTILRPTVVFGPGNRGNVHTLLSQVARGRAVVIGDGRNVKSMAYVENVAEVLVHALTFGPGAHVFNYADKPDLDMNELTALASASFGNKRAVSFRIPYLLGLGAGLVSDLAARLTGRRFALSAIRVRKYHATTQFSSSRILATGFVPRHDLRDALIATIRHEFGCAQGGTQPRVPGAAGLATTPTLPELIAEWEDLAEQASDRDISKAEQDAPLLARWESLLARIDHAQAGSSSRNGPTDRSRAVGGHSRVGAGRRSRIRSEACSTKRVKSRATSCSMTSSSSS